MPINAPRLGNPLAQIAAQQRTWNPVAGASPYAAQMAAMRGGLQQAAMQGGFKAPPQLLGQQPPGMIGIPYGEKGSPFGGYGGGQVYDADPGSWNPGSQVYGQPSRNPWGPQPMPAPMQPDNAQTAQQYQQALGQLQGPAASYGQQFGQAPQMRQPGYQMPPRRFAY